MATETQHQSKPKEADRENRKWADALFKTLYRQFAARLTLNLRRAFGDGPPDPEDMTQLAFQKLMERGDHEEICDLESFLWRTARNSTLNELRAAGTRTKYDFELEQLFFGPGRDETTPERVYSMRQQLAQVDAVLRGMPTRTRRCFLLHKVDGLSITKVAEVMGLSKTSVHRHVVKAGIEIDQQLQRHTKDGA
ncbi:MAG: sigma-70 family RNA polymerase sigma factor [Pseudomonadota bacterium]